MTLLALTSDELRQQIESELAANPALELLEERHCPTCRRALPPQGPCPVCSRPQTVSVDEPVVFVSPREDFFTSSSARVEDLPEEPLSPMEMDLPTYVLRQIATELPMADRKIAAHLLTHLDEDGLLACGLEEIARYHHVPISHVQTIQRLIQRADPVGVGSSSPQDALLIQIEVLRETQPVPELAEQIVRQAMDLLSRHQHAELARQFNTSLRTIQGVVKFISENLNPFPARSHWGDVRQPGKSGAESYHHPDILISYLNDDPKNPLAVEIILPISGMLRINPLFRQAIRQPQVTEENREALRGDLERASLFVKCIQQRNHTMQRLMRRVVALQRDFILHGERHLKPITRAQISNELDVHESTISRAVANKAVQLPNKRIVPLSEFFDRSLNVRTILRDLINQESRPLSDSELAKMLAKEGYPVARRTVAKYRSMEGILPAHLRQPVSETRRT
jgi:RNA polymerase sigma-54 factor